MTQFLIIYLAIGLMLVLLANVILKGGTSAAQDIRLCLSWPVFTSALIGISLRRLWEWLRRG